MVARMDAIHDVEHNLFWWNSPFLFFFYEKNVVFRIFTPNMKGFLKKKLKKFWGRGNISGRAGTLNKQFFLCGLIKPLQKTFPFSYTEFLFFYFDFRDRGFQKSNPGFLKDECGYFPGPGFSRVRIFFESEFRSMPSEIETRMIPDTTFKQSWTIHRQT
jgi:hypothetical protein